MGTGTIQTVGTGSPVEATGDLWDQYKEALGNDFVPRAASGAPQSGTSDLGTSTYKWRYSYMNRAFIDSAMAIGERFYVISNSGTTFDTNVSVALSFLATEYGGTIYIDNGTHSIDNTITLNQSNVRLKGGGKNITTISAVGALGSNDAFEITSAVDNVIFEDMSINGNGVATNVINISDATTVIFKNCKIEDGIASCVKINSSTANVYFINCEFEPDNSATAIGIDIDDGNCYIDYCKFEPSTSANGIAIDKNSGTSDNLFVQNCEFNDLDYGIQTDGTTWVNNCYFNNTDYPLYSNDLSVTGIIFKNNLINLAGLYSVRVEETCNDTIIKDNVFVSSSGTAVINFEKPETVTINGNQIRGCSSTYGIQLNNGAVSGDTRNVQVNNNQITECNGMNYGIFANLDSRGTSKGRAIQICNNTLSEIEGSSGDIYGIWCQTTSANVNNNNFDNFNQNDSANDIYHIYLQSMSKGTCSNNQIYCENTLNSASAVYGINGTSLSLMAIIGNIISIDVDSSSSCYGIQATLASPNRIVVNSNVLSVIVSGAGTGNAFNINTTEGVAVGNDYGNSDSIGTLTFSAGVVANNNA